MGKLVDLTGKRFGRLVVLSIAQPIQRSNGNKITMRKCQCDCGNEIITRGQLLRNGHTQSCGCLQKERARNANFKDITGEKFGKLTAIKPVGKVSYGKTSVTSWLCKCECGGYCEVSIEKLKSGHKKSCGCLRAKRGEQDVEKKKYTGKSKTRLYRLWMGMRTRCYNPKAGNYKYYGGIGVTVCDEWLGEHGFENFRTWSLKNGYSDDLTLDRKDNSKGYSPENCQWSTMKEQARNTRQVTMLEYKGETKSIPEWAEIIGITSWALKCRMKRGWSIEKCIETPPKTHLDNSISKNI